MGKVWILLVVTALAATLISAKRTHGVGIETTTKWPSSERKETLTGSGNRSESGGKWKNPLQDNTRYSKNPKRVRLHSHTQDGDRKSKVLPQGKKLLTKSEKLFTTRFSKKILKEIRGTNFFKGLVNGNCPLKIYRNYQAQDAVYLKHVAGLYLDAAKKMQINNNKVAGFYFAQSKKFTDIYQEFVDVNQLMKLTDDQVGEALKNYTSFLDNVAPSLLPTALLPCSKLYADLAETKIPQPSKNVYVEDWFEKNKRGKQLVNNMLVSSESSTEKFVNTFQLEKEKILVPVFNEGMLHELNFFREIGGQLPLYLKDIQDAPKLDNIKVVM